ncbi:hypothetical protein [Flavobacterium humi]|uniref:Lipoprotein n=1 Tax=Flavobacterium humi TaxID=2562683 RepID=A0A4Z0L6T4_9FLAO|nr:hypothetical protein [Flavobacterium humi]TGD57961.1 hypothetical protein E4635_08085 [Flavobacterium humi]
MHKPITFLLLILTFAACRQEKKQAENTPAKTGTETIQDPSPFAFDGLAVYELSKNTMAITYELNVYGEENTPLNAVFDKIGKKDSLTLFGQQPKNVHYLDTIGHFKLMRNLELENEVKKITAPYYYIYGTKSFQRVKIENVLYSYDECISSILAFPITEYDMEKCGHPLICSKKPLPLTYGANYTKEQEKINQYIDNQKHDYSNKTVKTKIFANIGSRFLTYNDDFIWGVSPSKSENYFPSRAIYTINGKGTVTETWGKCLDLFGVACD